MKSRKSTVLTGNPIVACLAEMSIQLSGMNEMIGWVQSRVPECMPDEYYTPRDRNADDDRWLSLFPHPMLEPINESDLLGRRRLTPNELLVELAGRKCYNSFGMKAGRKTNREYIANTQSSDVPHASIMYHAKMSFFIAGVSRRVSHELIRHYVGADRSEEGSPSQESTRYVEHAGYYVAHPQIVDNAEELGYFSSAVSRNYSEYLDYIDRRNNEHMLAHARLPTGMDRKRIFESASPYLSHSCETSFIWTTNPIALAKMFRERDHDAADLEYRRLAQVWKAVCVQCWPNLFNDSFRTPARPA